MHTKTPIRTMRIFNVLAFFFSLRKKMYGFLTVTISQKLRNAKKIPFMQKMSTRSIPIYPANLATFEDS